MGAKTQSETIGAFEHGLDAACDPVVVLTRDGSGPRVDYANPAFLSATGYDGKFIIGRSPAVFAGPDTDRRALARLSLAMRRRRPALGDLLLYRSDGDSFWVEASVSPLPANGETDAFLVVLRDIGERKKIEARLRESEARFGEILAAAGDWYWECDAEGRITVHHPVDPLNPAQEVNRMVGIRRDDIAADLHDTEKWSNFRADIAAHRPIRDFRYAVYEPNDTLGYRSVHGTPNYDESGAFLGYRGLSSNVTAEEREKQKAAAAQTHFLDAINRLNEGIALYGADNKLVFCNSQYRLYQPKGADIVHPGAALEEVVRAEITAGLAPDAAGREEEWMRARTDPHCKPWESTRTRWSGGKRFQVHEHRMEDGNLIVIVTDMTGKSGGALNFMAFEQDQFRRIADAMPVQLAYAGTDLHFRWVNKRYAEMAGMPREAIVGRHVREIIGDEAYVAQIPYRTRVLAGETVIFDADTTYNNSQRFVRIAFIPHLDHGDETVGIIVAIQDLTDVKQAQVSLVASKEQAVRANDAKSEFLANISHELRTPLNAILGFSEVMRDERLGPVENPRYKEYASDIYDSGAHLLNIIDELLDLSRLEAGRVDLKETVFPVAALLESCLSLVQDQAREAGVVVELGDATDLPDVHGDETKIRQIVLNLLSNAIKFSDASETVEVTAARTPTGELAIKVRDHGAGIAPDDMTLVLAPFGQGRTPTQKQRNGTGLGLAIAKKLVEIHGGELELESRLGAGTTATIRLPAERVSRNAA